LKESLIEQTCREYAESRGCLARKFSSPGNKGVLDYIYFIHGVCFLIEYKAPGKKASKLQKDFAEELSAAGIVCRCVDAIYKGKIFIDSVVREARVSKNNVAYMINTGSFE
jgi:hypothetical protein